MPGLPENPFYFLQSSFAQTTEPVICGRREHVGRARAVFDDFKKSTVLVGKDGVRGFRNLQNIFDMFAKYNAESIRVYKECVPALHTRLFKKLVVGALPCLFGKDYPYYRDFLRKTFCVDEVRKASVFTMPRRFGKSELVSLFASIFMLVTDIDESMLNAIIFSMNQDISRELMNSIKNKIRFLSDGKVVFTRENDKFFEFVNMAGMKSRIMCRIAAKVIIVWWPAIFYFILVCVIKCHAVKNAKRLHKIKINLSYISSSYFLLPQSPPNVLDTVPATSDDAFIKVVPTAASKLGLPEPPICTAEIKFLNSSAYFLIFSTSIFAFMYSRNAAFRASGVFARLIAFRKSTPFVAVSWSNWIFSSNPSFVNSLLEIKGDELTEEDDFCVSAIFWRAE